MEATDGSHPATTADPGSSGTYVLRELINDIPLSTDDNETSAHITCVDAWNGNLYIGTSTGEVLHYVSIPPDPADESGQPSYIFATRLEPPFSTQQEGADVGVKQILLLPVAGKACVLCNGTLTFYTLPELSPAFGGKIKQPGCLWVGGMDNDELASSGNTAYGTVIVICLKQRLRLIRIGEEARKIRDIELGGVSAIQRRQDLACVANGEAYSLLDVVNQRKNELFPISSLTVPETPDDPRLLDVPKSRNHTASRSFSAANPARPSRGHDRNVSLGAEPRTTDRLRLASNAAWPARDSSRQSASPGQPSSREHSPKQSSSADTSTRPSLDVLREAESSPNRPLLPNIVSPAPNEFLLTTGTKPSEPGVGMFVNLDGDVVRGTIEFSSYPECLVLDGVVQPSATAPDQDEQEGYVLALVSKRTDGGMKRAIEVQRWNGDPAEAQSSKQWLYIDGMTEHADDGERMYGTGLRSATSPTELAVNEIAASLRLRRLRFKTGPREDDEANSKRSQEEDRFVSRFAQALTSLLFYNQNKVYWVLRSALITRLETQLDSAVQQSDNGELMINVSAVQRVVNSIRGQEARNELEFLTLTYVRQKASLLLFGHLLVQASNGVIAYEHDKRSAEEALIAGNIDPRTILLLVTPLNNEVAEGKEGIWVFQGLRDTIDMLRSSSGLSKVVQDPKGAYGDNLLQLIRRYLHAWRKKKGFGSVADETNVFQTVDAALLHVLLMLDQDSPRGPATAGSVRAELNDVVDRGVDCFDRAVELFEQFQRLYMLSRLYQSRKMTAQVLSTWKRILEGEKDVGGELIEGEHDLRRYLTKLRDATLVQQYGSWLANRNAKLGIQVFADDSSRVKFQPTEAIAILKEQAPSAVKEYLEHLVFGKNHVQYVNDLIAFYLDTVLSELACSPEAKETLLQTYETYRALRPPKPTYKQFITDNALEAEWWHNRLRLLQLIGGSHGAASKYDVRTLGERLAPYSQELVPEMIILNGREGKHQEALRLLTHGLGDYDTAIRYCLLGGSSIFHPPSSSSSFSPSAAARAPEQALLPSKEEQAHLFAHLLHEFLRIEDLSERLERTAELLERFGGWFDVGGGTGVDPRGLVRGAGERVPGTCVPAAGTGEE